LAETRKGIYAVSNDTKWLLILKRYVITSAERMRFYLMQ